MDKKSTGVDWFPGEWAMLVPPDDEFGGRITLHILYYRDPDTAAKVKFVVYAAVDGSMDLLFRVMEDITDIGDKKEPMDAIVPYISDNKQFRDNIDGLLRMLNDAASIAEGRLGL